MAVFRVEKNKGYTVMSNHHLRNKELSLKAKGLLSQMLSLPEDWDYTLAGLSLINREKIDAIREAVRELENAGYIQRSRERDEKGCLRGTTYVIYEQPPKLDLPTLEKPTLDNPTLEKPMLEKPTLENPTQLNKELLKTNLPTKEKLNTDISSTHSIPFHSLNPSPLEDAAQPPERKRKETTDAYSVYEEIIKDNIKTLSIERGKTILISSHILSEIALLADDIGIIDHGVLLEENSMNELQKKNSKYILLQVSDIPKTSLVLERQFGVTEYSVQDEHTLRIYDTSLDMAAVNKALVVQDIAVISSQLCNDTLEDYFKKITGGEGIA